MTSSVLRSSGRFFALALVSALLSGSWALAGPVLHELFEPDPEEDLLLGATTQSGSLPAALLTQSGTVGAPPETAGTGIVYGGAGSAKEEQSYRLDPFTAPPERVSYDDPFRPATVPYKRAAAFDLVDDDLSLRVRSDELSPVTIGGSARADEDVFFASLDVELVASEPVRIVSVAAGARVLKLQSTPDRELEVLQDSAENWFLLGSRAGRVRVVMAVSAPRRAFGAIGPLGNWRRVARPEDPSETVRAAAEPVLREIAVSRALAPSDALARLVGYFRSFTPSSEAPRATSPRELYRELSLARRGVCRHRAYAFVVTATALGLRARLVQNEAHAWVEVFDGDGFVRIDLGGAALGLEARAFDPSLPLHEPPRDPFLWPAGQTGGLDLGRSVARSTAHVAGGWPSASEPGANASPGPSPDLGPEPDALVRLTLAEAHVQRGRPLGVKGLVTLHGKPCPFARVDLTWDRALESRSPLGSVATDEEGRYEGQVQVPPAAAVGDGVVRATLGTPCAAP